MAGVHGDVDRTTRAMGGRRDGVDDDVGRYRAISDRARRMVMVNDRHSFIV